MTVALVSYNHTSFSCSEFHVKHDAIDDRIRPVDFRSFPVINNDMKRNVVKLCVDERSHSLTSTRTHGLPPDRPPARSWWYMAFEFWMNDVWFIFYQIIMFLFMIFIEPLWACCVCASVPLCHCAIVCVCACAFTPMPHASRTLLCQPIVFRNRCVVYDRLRADWRTYVQLYIHMYMYIM